MKNPGSIFIIIMLFSLSSCKFIREKGWFGTGKADTLEVWHARQDSIRLADSIAAELEKIKLIEQAKIDSLQAIEDARLAWEARFRYHIIVGSFLTPEYANDHLDMYLGMGYNDAAIINDRAGRFNLVSAEAHESLKEAMKRLYCFQDTVDFESWIYVKD